MTKNVLIIIVLFASPLFANSQTDSNLSRSICHHLLGDDLEAEQAQIRPYLGGTEDDKSNPVYYAAGALLFMYQNVFSDQISAKCNYTTSCSDFTIRAINHYGPITGALIGLHQLSNCSGLIVHDHENCFINEESRIINEEFLY